jgi:hypothetical protein
VQVPNPPGGGKDIAEGKGVHREVESEGSRMWGARQMSAQLKMRGYQVGRKKARRYMNEMAIDPIYPKPNIFN